ncbi:hypothetical protein Cgig2_032849 [Carnegiea gigantea]|uniref:Uncharacterized protein n=1 Tax=Carnegiea gigantea TaxID=171969 RepID=A0A9Q1JP54_9CARY|nr:hypothetical protein Cgig2_032849 [Carnegiea gigantea]
MGAGSSYSGGAQPGSVMDGEWEMSSRSEYVPLETANSTDDTISMVDKSRDAIEGSGSKGDGAEEVHVGRVEGSGKRKSRKRRREPTVEGRRRRRKAAGDGFMFDKEGRGLRGVVLVSTELTAARVKVWVPQRKAFRLAGWLVPFSIYDVALSGLPVTGKIVEFGGDNLSTTKLARTIHLCMAQYVTVKSDNLKSEKGGKRPVFRNYMKKYMKDVRRMGKYAWAEAMWCVLVEAIEEIQRKLEGPVSDVQMNGFSVLIQVIPMLRPWEEEMLVPTVRAFMKTDAFQDYVLDGGGVLSYEERLERAREQLRAEKGKHIDTLRMLEF